MAEIIQFPTANETEGRIYTVCDKTNQEELVNVFSLSDARSIARIMAFNHEHCKFTVVDDTGKEHFLITEGGDYQEENMD